MNTRPQPDRSLAGRIQVFTNLDEDLQCTFCTERAKAQLKLLSTHPDRRLVIGVCSHCTRYLKNAMGLVMLEYPG